MKTKGCGIGFYIFLTLAVYVGKWSASHHKDFTHKKRPPYYQFDKLGVPDLVWIL
jgi:hypothetical protein